MPRRQLSDWAELAVSAAVALLMAIAIVLLIASLSGCRTVDATKTSSTVDGTAGQKSTYDSSSTKVWDWLLQFGKMTERSYSQGRDTPIILQNGEVQFIQLPGQLITERTIETRTEKASGEESTTLSRTDSLLIELLRKDTTKEKETSSIPVWGYIMFCLLGYFLLKDLFKR
jgi:hypothetical protein